MKHKRRTIVIIAVLLPSLFLLILAELGLQWYEKSLINARISNADSFWEASTRIHQSSDDTTLIYELIPSSEAVREGVRIKINSAGFRDDEFPEQVPYRGLRIVMLGDSVAWGWGVQMREAFPQLLESHLQEMNAKRATPPIVYNLAVDGYSTQQELRMLERRGLELQPDLVIFNYVLNDPDTVDGGLTRYYRSQLMLLLYARRAINRVKRILGPEPNLKEYHQQIHADHKEQVTDQFRQMGRISKNKGIPILVSITPVFEFRPGEPYRWQNIHDSIEQLCRQNGLLLVDLTSGFRGKDSSEFSFDLAHPNKDGHAVIARVLADYLNNFPWKR